MSSSVLRRCPDDVYDQVTALLSPRPAVVQEIAILPTPSHPTIQHDLSSHPPAIGIPKTLALSCFLRARSFFFSALGRHSRVDDEVTNVAMWRATEVMLLWDPNHLTAVNWRKSRLLRFLAAGENTPRAADQERFLQPVENELTFLTSLLTSPLEKHAKSDTLWAHRLWILRQLNLHTDPNSKHANQIWRAELDIVMSAGERHAANYHAWQHARHVVPLLLRGELGLSLAVPKAFPTSGSLESEEGDNKAGYKLHLRPDVVYKWCSLHPKDISGWSFLVFLVGIAIQDASEGGAAPEIRETTTWMIGQTRDFVEKYDWRGESIIWSLKTMVRWEREM